MPVAIPSRRYFEALELDPDHVGEEEIRAAYKRLALKWHPDRRTTDKEEAQEKFIEISEAYAILLEYYQHRRRGSPHPEKCRRQGQAASAPEPSASPSHEQNPDDAQTFPQPQSKKEPDAHSTHSSARTTNSTAPSSPRSSGSKLHKDRPRDASAEGRGTPSTRPDDHDERRTGRPSQCEGKSGARQASPPTTQHDSGHHSTARSSTEEGHKQPSPRSKDNLRAQSPRHSPTHLHGDAPAYSPTHSHPDSGSQFTWSRKRQARQRSDDSSTSQRRPGFFHKRSKLDMGPIDYNAIHLSTPIPPLRSPHYPQSHPQRDKDWTSPLHLTLEDLCHASSHYYRITRTLRSGGTETVKIPIPVDPSWRTGTRVVVPGVGNERADGSFQDIAFIVEVDRHPRFMRQDDDLIVAVQVPWEDPPRDGGEKSQHVDHAYVRGVDGEEFALPIPHTLEEGASGTRIVGAGMPVSQGGKMVGRGDLLVRWEFIFREGERAQPSRWQNLKKVMAMNWKT